MSEGDELIFLVSAPRSGSTLLQHMLGTHSEILTAPEPWFMLHFCYALRGEGLSAEFRSDYVALAFSQFLSTIPGGEDVYRRALAQMSLRIYDAALQQSGKSLFLDKTPRYYLILPELAALFPQAKFVLLVRNPIAIFASLLGVSLAGDWTRFRNASRWHDLMSAPRLLVAGARALGDRAMVVRYEDLVAEPQATLESICRHLGVAFEPGMLDYGGLRFDGTSFVDPKSIYRHTGPVRDYVDTWQADVAHEPMRSFARAYIQELGPDTVSALGYDYRHLEAAVAGRTRIGFRLRLWRRIIESAPTYESEFGARRDWERAMFRGFAIARRGMSERILTRARRVIAAHRGAS